MRDIENMIDSPELYGFMWGFGLVSAKIGGIKVVVCENAPHMEHVNMDLCTDTFGPRYFLDQADGTSARVRDQEVTRSACKDDLAMRKNTRELQRLVLERALNITRKRVRTVQTVVEKTVEVRIFVASDGTEFTSKADLMAHEVDLKLAK